MYGRIVKQMIWRQLRLHAYVNNDSFKSAGVVVQYTSDSRLPCHELLPSHMIQSVTAQAIVQKFQLLIILKNYHNNNPKKHTPTGLMAFGDTPNASGLELETRPPGPASHPLPHHQNQMRTEGQDPTSSARAPNQTP
ncbi:hypothetical protein CROQUDRAFT_93036 [Cronartium quercuum f. sp. fusiforme G11]|uniref:Uncharacterized protein n=1 Tax=Cronartium quercuum f. sp. fusiforme G11 TaxID=708437 RepID=A0A9P6NFV4_9BASI|nr:hypothetical protein CROQUDRAFT_93036 [Cronartium quercuum f. sp. fusiforme G11]